MHIAWPTAAAAATDAAVSRLRSRVAFATALPRTLPLPALSLPLEMFRPRR